MYETIQHRIVAGIKEVRIEPPRRMRGRYFTWDHEIHVALPASYGQTNRSYPVLWVTDGPWYFELAVKALNFDLKQLLPEMIVVAVGTPPEGLGDVLHRRSYEFLSRPTLGFTGFGAELFEHELKTLQSVEGGLEGGGAAQFLAFLVDELRSSLSRDYRMSDDHTLFGDSSGGFFCTYALLARPDAFSRYICGSPTLCAGDFDLFRLEERYAKEHDDLNATVFFGAGEAEIVDKSEMVPAWGVVSSTARMAEILSLRKYPSLKLRARIFSGENHASVVPLNLSWGLRMVWEDAGVKITP